jgi:CheY-like chemotaxis protein
LDLSQVVSGLEGMLRRLIPEHIEIVTRFDSGAAKVKADPGHMEQVILNLAVNARDAMPDGGRLIIETSPAELDEAYCRSHAPARPGRYVLLAVSDSGTGMDAETQTRIFEPFFTTKGVGQGTGLGLATVYGIVKQNEGYIWVYSELGRGTTFKAYLPRVDDAVARDEEPAPLVEAKTGSETVLLAEDDEAVRELNREILEEFGYHVLEGRDPQAALEAGGRYEGAIHLLLTDMVMPGMTGRQLADRLRASRPGIRVLFVSGYTNDVVVRSGDLDEGMAFLQKPFTPDQLARKLRELLEQPREVDA